MTITDLSDPNDEEGDYKNTGKRRTLVILQCDKAIETHSDTDVVYNDQRVLSF